MEWKIIDSLACPTTGTFFAAVSSPRNMKLILWYQSDFILRCGQSFSTSAIGIAINGRFRKMKILHVFPFDAELWAGLIKRTSCPGNITDFTPPCSNIITCLFKECPYACTAET